MEKTKFYIKQIFPLIYVSTYKDTKGNKYKSVWCQWFCKVIWVKNYLL